VVRSSDSPSSTADRVERTRSDDEEVKYQPNKLSIRANTPTRICHSFSHQKTRYGNIFGNKRRKPIAVNTTFNLH
jgi:hypothetical protein